MELTSNETIAKLAHRMMRITLRFPPTILPQFTRRAMSCCWTFLMGVDSAPSANLSVGIGWTATFCIHRGAVRPPIDQIEEFLTTVSA